MFNYAIYYIQVELGFSEEYFEEHDRHCGSYGRNQTIKIERIGKKYQLGSRIRCKKRMQFPKACRVLNSSK